MLIERTNLHRELTILRNKELNEQALLEEVKAVLLSEKETQEELQKRILSGQGEGSGHNDFDFELLETPRIFHLSQIKKICVAYRLRFLKTKFFKGELPVEATAAVKELEAQHGTTLKDFQMVAPAKYFRLENADDPMLFAPIGNDYFYLVHKWGRDVHPLRKLAMWPLKNLENLIVFSFFLAFGLAFGIREVFFSRFQATSEFLIIFLYTFKSVVALIFFYGISLGKNFSSGNWNSKFYNA